MSGITDITTLSSIQSGDIIRIITTNDAGIQISEDVTIAAGDSPDELAAKITDAFVNGQNGEVYARITSNGFLQILGDGARSFKITDSAAGTGLGLTGYQALGFGHAFTGETRGAVTLAAATVIAGHTAKSVSLYESVGNLVEAGDRLSGTYKDSSGNTIWSGFGAGSQITFNLTNAGVANSTGAFTVTSGATFQDLIDHINMQTNVKPFLAADFDYATGSISIRSLQDTVTKLEISFSSSSPSIFDIGLGDPTGNIDPLSGAAFQIHETAFSFSNAHDLNYFNPAYRSETAPTTTHVTGENDLNSTSNLVGLGGISNGDVIRIITTNNSGTQIFQDITINVGDTAASLAAKITNAFVDFQNSEISARVTQDGHFEIAALDSRSFKVTSSSTSLDIGQNGYNILGLGDFIATETRNGFSLVSTSVVNGNIISTIPLFEAAGNLVDGDDILIVSSYKDSIGNVVWSGFNGFDTFNFKSYNSELNVTSTAALSLSSISGHQTFDSLASFINSSAIGQDIFADFDDSTGKLNFTAKSDEVTKLEFSFTTTSFGNFDIGLGDSTGNLDPLIKHTPGIFGYNFAFSDVAVTNTFEASAFLDPKHIFDFDPTEGDKLDISDLLSGYDPLTDLIESFVRITDDGVNSILSVDADGGANNFVKIATLFHSTGLTNEELLETNGILISY